MPNTVSIDTQSKIPKQPVMVVSVVLLAHFILIWALTYLIVPYHVYSPSKNQAITVRLISIPKSDQNDLTHGTQQQAASPQIAPNDLFQPPVSRALPTKQPIEQEIILSTSSEKNSAKQRKAETIEKINNVQAQAIIHQPNKVTTPIETQRVRSVEQGQGQSEQGQLTSDHKQQSNAIAQGRSGDVTGQDQTLTQSMQALSEPMKPIAVNRVDVLSFGTLSYTDRELQQKNRLVILSIFIDSKGNPVQISIKQSSGMHHLDQMVVKAAEKAKFKAHKINGQAVPVVVDFPIDLQLSQRGKR